MQVQAFRAEDIQRIHQASLKVLADVVFRGELRKTPAAASHAERAIIEILRELPDSLRI